MLSRLKGGHHCYKAFTILPFNCVNFFVLQQTCMCLIAIKVCCKIAQYDACRSQISSWFWGTVYQCIYTFVKIIWKRIFNEHDVLFLHGVDRTNFCIFLHRSTFISIILLSETNSLLFRWTGPPPLPNQLCLYIEHGNLDRFMSVVLKLIQLSYCNILLVSAKINVIKIIIVLYSGLQ